MEEQLSKLESLLPKLSSGDARFAASLIDQGRRRGLSEKQRPWVERPEEEA